MMVYKFNFLSTHTVSITLRDFLLTTRA